jgi:hypothetical protein
MTNPVYQPNDIMAALTLDTLPDAILLEICTYLVLVDVVALSEVTVYSITIRIADPLNSRTHLLFF